jgi:hypothetical protein
LSKAWDISRNTENEQVMKTSVFKGDVPTEGYRASHFTCKCLLAKELDFRLGLKLF